MKSTGTPTGSTDLFHSHPVKTYFCLSTHHYLDNAENQAT